MPSKIIKNCPKCNQPLTPGNIKKEPFGEGKYSHRVHKVCPPVNPSVLNDRLHSSKPKSHSLKSARTDLKTAHSHLTDARPYVERELVSGSNDAVVFIKPIEIKPPTPFPDRKFFLDPVTFAKLKRIVGSGGQAATLSVMIVPAHQPETDPEMFRGYQEVYFSC